MKKAIAMVVCAVLLASASFGVSAASSPAFSSMNITDEDGLTEDVRYTLPPVEDGEERTIDLTPQEGLIMLNGSFVNNARVLTLEMGQYVPVRAVIEGLGGTVTWNGSEQSVTVQIGGDTLRFAINGKTSVLNGVAQSLAVLGSAKLVGGSTYIPLGFVGELLALPTYLLTGAKTADGIRFAPCDMVAIYAEDPEIAFDEDELTDHVKNELTKALENSKASNAEDRFATEFAAVVPEIEEDITNTIYHGNFGRYALFTGPYPIWVDMETKAIYFFAYGNAFASLYEIDAAEVSLFWHLYIAG